MANNDLQFKLYNMRIPWSAQRIPFVYFSLYSDYDCNGIVLSQFELSSTISPTIARVSKNNFELTSSSKELCAADASNYLNV